MGIKMTHDGLASALERIRSLGEDRVLVGIPAEDAFRKPEPGEKSVPNNAMLGFIHENGSPAANIPARPFLVPGVRAAQEQIGAVLEGGIRRELAGSPQDMDVTLHKVGLIAQSSVRQKITDGPFAPLAPKTLAKRRAKGRTGERPLIDSGQLKNSISYVIRDA